jgi:hypothetical protein
LKLNKKKFGLDKICHEKTTFVVVFIPDGSREAIHLYPVDEVEEGGALLPG